jgi:hypothetical protein
VRGMVPAAFMPEDSRYRTERKRTRGGSGGVPAGERRCRAEPTKGATRRAELEAGPTRDMDLSGVQPGRETGARWPHWASCHGPS